MASLENLLLDEKPLSGDHRGLDGIERRRDRLGEFRRLGVIPGLVEVHVEDQAGTVGLMAGLAGCQIGAETETVAVPVFNEDRTPHDVSVSVRFRGEALLDRTVRVEAGGETGLSFQNPAEGGDATVAVAVADGETLEETIAVGPGSGLEAVQVTIAEGGGASVAVGVR